MRFSVIEILDTALQRPAGSSSLQRNHHDDCVSVRMSSLTVDVLRASVTLYEENDDRLLTIGLAQLLLRDPKRVLARMIPFDPDSAKGVLREHPTLGKYGFTDDDKQAQTGFAWDAVELALLWLACLHPVFGRECGSYALKHTIEESIGRYVANGEAILAALLLPGFYIVTRDGSSPNAIICAEPQQ